MILKKGIRESNGDKIFLTIIYIGLVLITISVMYPLVYIVSSSISSPYAVISGKVWLFPVDISFDGYRAVFNNSQVLVGYGNSLYYALAGAFVSVAVTIMMAYPLSRKSFYGRNFFTFLLTFTMLFSGGLIPTYLVIKELHLLDTRWALIIPGAISAYSVIIARTFFQSTIPDELVDASELDGCSDLGFLIRIVLPLSKPIIAVLALFTAVGQWNAYFDALIYLKSSDLYPLQLVLRNILLLNTENNTANLDELLKKQGIADLMKYSLIVVSSLPVMIAYPLVQRYFVKGVMIGSLKG